MSEEVKCFQGQQPLKQIVIKKSDSPYRDIIIEFHSPYGVIGYDFSERVLRSEIVRNFFYPPLKGDVALQQQFNEQPFSD